MSNIPNKELRSDSLQICRSGAAGEDLDGLRQLALDVKRAASGGGLDGHGARLLCRSEEILSELDAMWALQSDTLMHQGLLKVFDELLNGKLCDGIDESARQYILARRKEEQSSLDGLKPRMLRLSEIRLELQDLAGSLPGNVIAAALPQGGYGLKGPEEKRQQEKVATGKPAFEAAQDVPPGSAGASFAIERR